MQVIEVPSRLRPYTVHIADSWDFMDVLHALPNRCYVIDENVWKRYRDLPSFAAIEPEQPLILPIKEAAKTLEGCSAIYDHVLKRSSKKNTTLIAVGGGILQDVAGFAASTLYRGIPWIYVPTTLLAQSDSCIGGKTSLNYLTYKNLLGTFYPPKEIYINVQFLATLSELDFFSGLGEVVKLHMIDGRDAVEWYKEHRDAIGRRDPHDLQKALVNSLRIKTGFIAEDEFDQGRRNILNFGHCFGHALESVSRFAVPHGQAVLIGILFAILVAKTRHLLSAALCGELSEALILPHVVVPLEPDFFDSGRIFEAMKKDKKRTGSGLALILMNESFEMSGIADLGEAELLQAISELLGLLRVPQASGCAPVRCGSILAAPIQPPAVPS